MEFPELVNYESCPSQSAAMSFFLLGMVILQSRLKDNPITQSEPLMTCFFLILETWLAMVITHGLSRIPITGKGKCLSSRHTSNILQ
jgi:hypothetical protein